MQEKNKKFQFLKIFLPIYLITFFLVLSMGYGFPPDFKTWRFGFEEFLFIALLYTLPLAIVLTLLIKWATNKSKLITILIILILILTYVCWFLPIDLWLVPLGSLGPFVTLVPVILLIALPFVLLRNELKTKKTSLCSLLKETIKETSGLAIFSFLLAVLPFVWDLILIPIGLLDLSFPSIPILENLMRCLSCAGECGIPQAAVFSGIISLIYIRKTKLKGKSLAIIGIILGLLGSLFLYCL